jgi:hypothetical protein
MSLDVTLYSEVDVGGRDKECVEWFSANITHNLTEMADKAGIYKALWRPDENGYKQAKDILDILRDGYGLLKYNPAHYRQYDADNGWGTYDDFLPWVEEYLDACAKYPDAYIEVRR